MIMLPVLFGLIAAMLFGLASYLTYGLEGLAHYAWIDTVFWSLILTGVVVTLAGELNQCLPCKLKLRFKNNNWLETLCERTPCIN
jgi:hypothetical protein